MFRSIPSVLLLAAASLARAQDSEVQVPPARPNFSQVVGDRYNISSTAAPTEVDVEEPITLKVRISGQGPAQFHPQRKTLLIFPEDLGEDFHVEAVADQDTYNPEKELWEFVYRLRPKHAKVTRIPDLQLLYYAPGPKKFQSAFTDEIPIKVRRRQAATAEKLNLKLVPAPARFYRVRPEQDMPSADKPVPAPGPELLAALVAMPPLLCFLWYRVWRRLYPNAAEQRYRRRSRAARLALASLQKRAGDVPCTRVAAVEFLRQRLDLAAVEATPREVARHLKRLGIAKHLIAEWTTFLQSCDRFRFAPSAEQPGNSLHGQAVRLIHAVEADPCATRA